MYSMQRHKPPHCAMMSERESTGFFKGEKSQSVILPFEPQNLKIADFCQITKHLISTYLLQ